MSKPSSGPWQRSKYGTIYNGVDDTSPILISGVAIPCGVHPLREEAEANRDLLFEAGTVYHETGLTPRQLAEQRAELLECVRGLWSLHNCVTMGQERELANKWWPVARTIITKLEAMK